MAMLAMPEHPSCQPRMNVPLHSWSTLELFFGRRPRNCAALPVGPNLPLSLCSRPKICSFTPKICSSLPWWMASALSADGLIADEADRFDATKVGLSSRKASAWDGRHWGVPSLAAPSSQGQQGEKVAARRKCAAWSSAPSLPNPPSLALTMSDRIDGLDPWLRRPEGEPVTVPTR
jgi:hypothetical protein